MAAANDKEPFNIFRTFFDTSSTQRELSVKLREENGTQGWFFFLIVIFKAVFERKKRGS